jgi:hypothetical protein
MRSRSSVGFFVIAFSGASVAAEPSALACGVSGADGVSGCSLSEHEEAARPRWHVATSGVFTSTALNFGGGLRGDETRWAALALAAYAPSAHVTLQAGAGGAFGGSLTLPDGQHDFSPGPMAAVGASWRVVDSRPFVVLSSQLTFAAATTQLRGPTESAVGYEAFDLRVGIVVGWTVLDVLSPYALTRAFGGPVYWHYRGGAVIGTDVSHYQVGAGLAARITQRLDLFAEGVPLGERAVALGVGMAF